MKRGNRRDNAGKWLFTSNLRHEVISSLATRESSDTVTWSGGGWDGRGAFFSPYSF